MRKNVWMFLLGMILGSLAPTWAMPFQTGKYTIDVEVRNAIMLPIFDAKVRCFRVSSKRIKIIAEATGYQPAVKYLDIIPNQTFYKHDFSLADLEKDIYISDVYGNVIGCAYLVLDQYGFASNEYGLTAYIPKKLWSNPTSENVDVFDTFWGFPLKLGAEIELAEDFYRVKLRVPRKALEMTTRQWIVAFAFSLEDDPPQRRQPLLDRLARLETDPAAPPGSALDLATFLYRNIPRDGLLRQETLPPTMRALLDQGDRFDRLHRDVE